jgi:hypothetical protein
MFSSVCAGVQQWAGQSVRVFSESLLVMNAYRGDLLGLMAIHLILLSVNTISPQLLGSVVVV